MTNVIKGFFAYPLEPPSIPETIRSSISSINKTRNIALKSWQDCSVSGKFVIDVICREINDSDFFCADLTEFNPNVMFELGYAIARRKRIWLILDTTIENSKKVFDQLRILTTVGYVHYCNSSDITNGFFRDSPWIDLEKSIFAMSIEPTLSAAERETLLYLKAKHSTEADNRLSSCIDRYKLPITIDDPRESAVQTLVWYAQKINASMGVLVHICGPSREGALLHNSRYSFVSGLAYGFEKPLLILAESDFISPIDYRDILKNYQTATNCVNIANEWLNNISSEYSKREDSRKIYTRSVSMANDLKSLRIGEYIAENEKEELEEYFVETSAFLESLKGHDTLVVGRKGSGKTANLFAIESFLKVDKRNLVCVIKPASYELESIVRLLISFRERDEKGYLIESLWKFLIYSEIAIQTASELSGLPPSAIDSNSDEYQLLKMISENKGILHEEFAVRLENAVESLFNIVSVGSVGKFRVAVSEKLHDGILKELRALLGRILSDRNRVVLLIDNLDRAWDKRSDLESLSDFLLGLLRVSRDIQIEFSKVNYWRKEVSVSLTIFLRTDIFTQIMKFAREPDKISYSRLIWDDPEVLLRVIDERLIYNRGSNKPAKEIWREMFCSEINGVPIKDYVINRVLPRPRDIVFYIRAAISTAVNRGHTRVEEQDILEAEKLYSHWVFDIIQIENNISVPELKAILYEFVGQNAIINEYEALSLISKAGIDEKRQAYAIQQLCALSFLGVEVKQDEYRFSAEEEEAQKNYVLARKLAESRNGLLRYKIHEAFHLFLEITTEKDAQDE